MLRSARATSSSMRNPRRERKLFKRKKLARASEKNKGSDLLDLTNLFKSTNQSLEPLSDAPGFAGHELLLLSLDLMADLLMTSPSSDPRLGHGQPRLERTSDLRPVWRNPTWEYLLQRAQSKQDLEYYYSIHLNRLKNCKPTIPRRFRKRPVLPKVPRRFRKWPALPVFPVIRLCEKSNPSVRSNFEERRMEEVYQTEVAYLLEMCEKNLKMLDTSFVPSSWTKADAPKLGKRWGISAQEDRGWTGLDPDEEIWDFLNLDAFD